MFDLQDQDQDQDKDRQESDWKDLYRSALLELDRSKLPESIERARNAIQLRIDQLAKGEGESVAERQALEDALQNLRVLAKIK